jgi:hypothetical protein
MDITYQLMIMYSESEPREEIGIQWDSTSGKAVNSSRKEIPYNIFTKFGITKRPARLIEIHLINPTIKSIQVNVSDIHMV